MGGLFKPIAISMYPAAHEHISLAETCKAMGLEKRLKKLSTSNSIGRHLYLKRRQTANVKDVAESSVQNASCVTSLTAAVREGADKVGQLLPPLKMGSTSSQPQAGVEVQQATDERKEQ